MSHYSATIIWQRDAQAFVASLSSCHMLWFLDIAARARWVADHHQAHASCFIANSVKTEVRCEPVLHTGHGKPSVTPTP